MWLVIIGTWEIKGLSDCDSNIIVHRLSFWLWEGDNYDLWNEVLQIHDKPSCLRVLINTRMIAFRKSQLKTLLFSKTILGN